jgi:hypothetical protein
LYYQLDQARKDEVLFTVQFDLTGVNLCIFDESVPYVMRHFSDIAAADRQISMTQKVADKEARNANTSESSSSASQLKCAVEWANNYPIQTIPVMRHLTSLLPERGFIQSFTYNETGDVTISSNLIRRGMLPTFWATSIIQNGSLKQA